MKIGATILIGLVIALSIQLSSCKNTLTPGIDQIVFPDTGTVSYNGYVQRLFYIGCNNSGCHDADSKAGGLDLTNYFSMINSLPSPVIRGDSTNSLIIKRVKGIIPPLMPPPPLGAINPNQVHGLARWVQQGAQYN